MSPGSRHVHLIGCGPDEGTPAAPAEVGFKAFNLLRIARLGVPVPPAFVLGTSWCREFLARGRLPTETSAVVAGALSQLESATGLGFGSARRPLLVSVRSGAPVSMPGMLETVPNVGLSDATASGLLRLTGNPRLVWDSYRRLVESYATVVAGLPGEPIRAAARAALDDAGAADVRELDFRGLRRLVRAELDAYEGAAGEPFPQEPTVQLERAIAAVFRSWYGDKARWYRRAHAIDESVGTAATVQRMVFGNAGAGSGAGVGFTRDPADGAARPYLDYAPNAQGEDVVAGRTAFGAVDASALLPPGIGAELAELGALLEREFRDAQEFEFTVQDGHLHVLQTRDAKRTPLAALRIAVELAEAGVIAPTEARARVATLEAAAFEIRAVDADPATALATGIGASVGVATGEATLDPARARARRAAGRPVILIREDVATDDIAAIEASAGLVTARGARTSHAAVVARQLGLACIVGCEALDVHPDHARLGGRVVADGELLTVDAAGGRIYAGAVPVRTERPTALLERLARLGPPDTL